MHLRKFVGNNLTSRMENFGCMIFRDYYFLVNESTSLPLRQRIARLICHEGLYYLHLRQLQWDINGLVTWYQSNRGSIYG